MRFVSTAAALVSSFVVLVSANLSAAQSSFDSNISSFSLSNGLQIVVIPDNRAPVVTHMIWYKAGSADEPIGKSGIAHYLEHLMFKGTSNVPAGEFSRKVAEIGGQENAFTSFDYTGYYQKVTPEALEMVMGYEADRMENLVLTDDVIEPERKVILEERRSRIENNPAGIMSETLEATLFLHHPYGNPIIGYENEILGLTRQDAIEFYNRFYTPNNAVVIVAGDVDEATVRKLAQNSYGKVKRRAEPGVRQRAREPVPRVARKVIYEDARVNNPSWRRHYLVPSYNTAEPGEAEALDLLATILGGTSTSRTHRDMVIDSNLATNVHVGYRGGSREKTRLSFTVSPRGETTISQVEASIDLIINNLLEDGITQEELKRAKNALVKSAIYSRDSQTTMARIIGAVLAMDGELSDVLDWTQNIKKVTVADVLQVARKYLKIERSVTGYLLPKKASDEKSKS